MRRRRLREIHLQVARCADRVDPAVLALQRHAVLVVDEDGVEDARAGREAEAIGHVSGRGLLARELNHRLMLVAALGDLLVQVADRQRRRHLVQLRCEGADALHALDQALGLQLAQRAVDRHAADAEARHQFGLRGHARARREAAARQRLLEVLLDARERRCVHLGSDPS